MALKSPSWKHITFSFVDLESIRQGDRFSFFTSGADYFSINQINGIARSCDDERGFACGVNVEVERVPFAL